MIAQWFKTLGRMLTRWCAGMSGASLAVLDACEQDGDADEYSKYAKLGLMMLVVGCLSGASSAYAMFVVCQNWRASGLFGVFWGMVILSLDRLIVATWTLAASWWANVVLIGSRFGLSLLIGFLISYPVELAIFHPEIASVLEKERSEAALSANATIENDPTRKQEREDLLQQKKTLRDEMAKKDSEVQRLYEEFKAEAEGSAGTGKFGYGPVARQKEERYRECKHQYDVLYKRDMAQIAAIDGQLDQLRQSKQQSLVSMDRKQEQATGLLARASALHRLMAERPVVAWIKWGITCLLLLLETLPMLVKLQASLSGKSAYEAKQAEMAARVLDKERHANQAQRHQHDLHAERSRQRLEQTRQTHQADLDAQRQMAAQQQVVRDHDHQTTLQKRDLSRQAELQRQQDEQDLARQHNQTLQSDVAAHTLPQIAHYQKHLMDVALDHWAKEQEALIRANPSRVVQTP